MLPRDDLAHRDMDGVCRAGGPEDGSSLRDEV